MSEFPLCAQLRGFDAITVRRSPRPPPCSSGSSTKQSDEMVDAATLEKLEAGFQKLQAATDCKSLLKKYLTKEVFDSLKTKKTSFGSTLLDVIQSGE